LNIHDNEIMGRTIPSHRFAIEREEENGKYLEKNWTKAKERFLMRWCLIRACIMLLE